ncbi:adenosine receptor A2b [Nematostella vectensis]|uniref:adenosine receptor A2b n=1 Tax=Nematostella vectensis TaxID=45351 RepID=UPI00207768C1|nr:adenosine receptor A2b [Nematostella vectensis]XP_032234761.2 adenosine receptor A2b [Nematostella vectensis]XP_032234762.2 adenosine receptor A2b [Nematostella vectensis]
MPCNSSSDTPCMPPTQGSLWYWSIRAVIALVGAIGNGIVIYVIVSTRRLQVPPNWFVMSLAVADLSVTVVVAIPEFMCSRYYDCDWWDVKVLYDVCLYASVLNLCAMTFDRYLSVVHPLKYQRCLSTANLIGILAAAWITALLVPFPYYIALRLEYYTAFSVLQMLVRCLLEMVPCVLLLATYLRMFVIARRQTRRVEQQRNQLRFNYNLHAKCMTSRTNSSVRAVGIVVGIFISCYAVAAYKGWMNYVSFVEVDQVVVDIARMLYHVNSAANCIVYALCRKDVRKEVKIALCGKMTRVQAFELRAMTHSSIIA